MTTTKHPTKPVPDLTTRQAAVALYGSDNPAAIRQVQRDIERGDLEAKKLPGKTGAYLITCAALRAFQAKKRKEAGA